MNVPSSSYFDYLNSNEFINESILSPANCFFPSMSIDTSITIQEATPQESPMMINKNMMNMSISIPEMYNNNGNYMDMSNYISPLTSPFDVDPSLIFFQSSLTSPTYELFPSENLARRYSTPGTTEEYQRLENKPKKTTRRKTSLRKLSNCEPVKLFVCEEEGCNKVFKRSEHLKRHVKSIHTNERPFVCQVAGCNKKFARSDNLNQHSRIHRSNEEKLMSRGFTSFTPYVLPPTDNPSFNYL